MMGRKSHVYHIYLSLGAKVGVNFWNNSDIIMRIMSGLLTILKVILPTFIQQKAPFSSLCLAFLD